MNANRVKYHQTEEYCPFLQEPLISDFGPLAERPATDQALNGQYIVPPQVDQYTRDFIHVCAQPRTVRDSPCKMERSAKVFQDSWKKMNERTSSRQVHFGHFKAGCTDDLITLVHYVMAEIPLRTGYSPSRWKEATDVMILKKSRTIQRQQITNNSVVRGRF